MGSGATGWEGATYIADEEDGEEEEEEEEAEEEERVFFSFFLRFFFFFLSFLSSVSPRASYRFRCDPRRPRASASRCEAHAPSYLRPQVSLSRSAAWRHSSSI